MIGGLLLLVLRYKAARLILNSKRFIIDQKILLLWAQLLRLVLEDRILAVDFARAS